MKNYYLSLNDPKLLSIDPILANEIGFNQSIILLELIKWIGESDIVINNKRWVKKSVQEIHEIMPFISISTINRAISDLKERELIDHDTSFNSSPYDKTRWYCLNAENVLKLKSLLIKSL